MKRILLLIFISFVLININAQNQINVKKATVRDWIIYQGDTLAVVSISGDTIFVTQGESIADTGIFKSYWTKSTNDIQNNNTGKVILPKDSTYFSGIPDEATKVGRIAHINQFGKIEWVSPLTLGDTIAEAGGGFWELTQPGSDTIKADYHVRMDSSFLMQYNETEIGYKEIFGVPFVLSYFGTIGGEGSGVATYMIPSMAAETQINAASSGQAALLSINNTVGGSPLLYTQVGDGDNITSIVTYPDTIELRSYTGGLDDIAILTSNLRMIPNRIDYNYLKADTSLSLSMSHSNERLTGSLSSYIDVTYADVGISNNGTHGATGQSAGVSAGDSIGYASIAATSGSNVLGAYDTDAGNDTSTVITMNTNGILFTATHSPDVSVLGIYPTIVTINTPVTNISDSLMVGCSACVPYAVLDVNGTAIMRDDVRFDAGVTYQDTFWRDAIVSSLSLASGANAPTMTAITGTNILMPGFNYQTANDEMYGNAQLNHDYKLETDIEAHCHWSINTSPASGSDTVVIEFEYAWADINEAIPASTTVVKKIPTYSASGGGYHRLSELVSAITGPGGDGLSSIIWFRIERLQDNASDTYNGFWLLHDVDFHYQIDAPGSDDELVK